jgi:hypothetical protein
MTIARMLSASVGVYLSDVYEHQVPVGAREPILTHR